MLIELLILLLVCGLIVYLIQMWAPDPIFVKIAITVMVIIIIIWLVDGTGALGTTRLRLLR